MNAVIFDMDGVLIDSERVVLEGFRYAGKKTGVPNAERMAIVGLGLNDDVWIEKLRLEFGADAMRVLEHFYAEEADHIGRTLRIQKGALNSILDYSLHSNLGVLKNLVQLSCAKAFLRENVAGNRTGEIAVTFSDLSFQTYNVSAETEKYAHGDLRFAEDLVVPNQRIQSSAADEASFVDAYDFVESRLSGEQEQHHDAGNLQQIVAAEIDNYYMGMERALQAPDVDQSLLDSVLFPRSIGICSEFLSRASYALNHVYPPIAATLLAMHISAVHEGFSRDVQGCRRSTLGKVCHDGFANRQFLRCEG